jgi:hypothetical protein
MAAFLAATDSPKADRGNWSQVAPIPASTGSAIPVIPIATGEAK